MKIKHSDSNKYKYIILFLLLTLYTNTIFSQEKAQSSVQNIDNLIKDINYRVSSLENQNTTTLLQIKNIDERVSNNVENITRWLAIIAIIIALLNATGAFLYLKNLMNRYNEKYEFLNESYKGKLRKLFKTERKKSNETYKSIENVKLSYIESIVRIFTNLGHAIIESSIYVDETMRNSLNVFFNIQTNILSNEESTVRGALQQMPVIIRRLDMNGNNIIHYLNNMRQFWIVKNHEGLTNKEQEKASRIVNQIDHTIQQIINNPSGSRLF
jgi:hypothetical protein